MCVFLFLNQKQKPEFPILKIETHSTVLVQDKLKLFNI